jgi:hypothetical protein
MYDLVVPFQQLIVTHKNFNINQQDRAGNTALMYAVRIVLIKEEVVKILVDAGANPELVNFAGVSPLAHVKEAQNAWINPHDMDRIIDLLEQAIEKKYENK